MNLSNITPNSANLAANGQGGARQESYRSKLANRKLMATGPKADQMAAKGRYGDTKMAHVTDGEIVVPLPIQTPEVVGAIKQEMDRAGIPLGRYVVGNEQNSINPSTGEQEHGIGSFLKKAIGVAIPAITGFASGDPLGAFTGALSGLGGMGGGSAGGSGVASGGGVLPNLPAPNAAAVASDNAAARRPKTRFSGAGDIIQDLAPMREDSGQNDMDSNAQVETENGGFSLARAANILDILTKAINGGGESGGVPEFFDASAPRAYAVNSMNPRTRAPEFYYEVQAYAPEDYTGPGRNQREIDIRNLGYTGAFGRGQADSWLNTKYGTPDLEKINKPAAPAAPATPAAPAAPANNTPAPATPAASTSSSATRVGGDSAYDYYKPGGSELRVVSIAPGKTSTANARTNLGGYATNDDLVTLSDGRTVLANTLKGTNGDYRISAGSIINPETNSVIGSAAPRNDMKGLDYYAVGTTPYAPKPTTPAAPAAEAAPQAPATPSANPPPIEPYYTPKYLNELIGRELGYTGPWGAGGMAAWEKANPAKSAQLQALLAQRGGQRQLSQQDIEMYGAAAGLRPPVEPQAPAWLKEIQDRLAALQAAQKPPQAPTSTTTSTGTAPPPTAQPEEPTITRVSPLNPTRSRRFGSRRYRGSLARNF